MDATPYYARKHVQTKAPETPATSLRSPLLFNHDGGANVPINGIDDARLAADNIGPADVQGAWDVPSVEPNLTTIFVGIRRGQSSS